MARVRFVIRTQKESAKYKVSSFVAFTLTSSRTHSSRNLPEVALFSSLIAQLQPLYSFKSPHYLHITMFRTRDVFICLAAAFTAVSAAPLEPRQDSAPATVNIAPYAVVGCRMSENPYSGLTPTE